MPNINTINKSQYTKIQLGYVVLWSPHLIISMKLMSGNFEYALSIQVIHSEGPEEGGRSQKPEVFRQTRGREVDKQRCVFAAN